MRAFGQPTRERLLSAVQQERTGLFVILAVTLMVFLSSLPHPFQYDDLIHILGNRLISDPLGYFRAFGEKGYSEWTTRLVSNLTLSWNYFVFGFNPAGYHATNLLIHLVNIALIWRFARTVLDRAGNPNPFVPLAAAAFFAVHPLNTEAVVYCNARPNTLCTALYLITMLALMDAVECRASHGRERLARWSLFGLLLGVTLLTKELAVTIVVTAPLLLLWLGQGPSPLYRSIRSRVVWLMAGLFVVGMAAIALTGAWSYLPLASVYTSGWGLGSYLFLNAAGQAVVFFKYLGLALAPLPSFLNVDHDVRPLYATLHPGNEMGLAGSIELLFLPILCLLGVLGLILGALAVRKRMPLVSYFLLWPVLTHAPTSLVPRGEQMVEYRTYLPMVGIALLFALASGWLVNALGERRHVPLFHLRPKFPFAPRLAFVSAMMALFVGGTVERAAVWKTQESLWTDMIAKSPQKARGYVNLGHVQESSGKFEAAMATYTRGIERVSDQAKLYYNRGNARAALGDPSGAIADFSRALEQERDFAAAFNNRGKAWLALGRVEEALEDYTRALAADPNHDLAYNNRAAARAMMGDLAGALADSAAALNANPELAEALFNRGNLRSLMGDTRGALRDYRDALRANPEWTRADSQLEIQNKSKPENPHPAANNFPVWPDGAAEGLRLAGAPFDVGSSRWRSSARSALGSGVRKTTVPLTPAERLAQALDSTNLVWKTGGSAPWFDYTWGIFTGLQPFGDIDAAASGLIQDNQESWIEAEIPVPGTLVFTWGVFSQTNSDALHFFIGDRRVASISGPVWWRRWAFEVPAGTVRWIYSKDANGKADWDRGYLNAVAFHPSTANAPPSIIQPPVPPITGSVAVGEEAILSVGASGESPLSYQWHKDSTPLPGATSPTLILRDMTSVEAGFYHVTVSNRLGSVTSPGALLFVSTAWLASALDTLVTRPDGRMVWATGGNKSWVALTLGPEAQRAPDRQDSAASGGIGHDQESWIDQTVVGPILVSFWWKVSSETEADFLRFEIGEAEVARISGEVNWREETFEVPSGPQRLRWRYTKNSAINVGEDRGGLDQVSFRLSARQLLAVAVDATNLVWRTGGNASWFGYTQWSSSDLAPFDRRHAARSGIIADNQQSWIETDIAGPGTLAFAWSVSSQTNADALRIYLGGTEMAAISGSAKWQVQLVPVPAGSHTARWEYSKDGRISEGMDQGALDQVSFVPLGENRPPTIVHGPQSQVVNEGSDVSFSVIAVAAEPVTYQWHRNGVPISGATEPVFTLRRVTSLERSSFHVVVANAAGAVTSAAAYLTVQTSPFTFALDAPGLIWATGGDAPWFVTSTLPGAFYRNAAASGAIARNQTSWIETIATGPALLQFRWSVSSETGADFLRFILGETEVASISGRVNWAAETFVLPAGDQILRWEYTKNSQGSVGLDSGSLDRVVISSGAPLVSEAPQHQRVIAGDPVLFSVVAAGFPSLTYQWFKDGAAIAGATNAMLSLGTAQNADASLYSVAVSNPAGTVRTPGATWTLAQPVSLEEALDALNLSWSTGGDALWVGLPRGSFPAASDGIDAAKSGLLARNQESWVQTTVTGPVTMQFWWKVSSENNSDFLRLMVGETEVARISGEIDWRPESAAIPAGEHRVRWQYSKDAAGSAGLDRAWLDQVNLVKAPTTPKILLPPESRAVWEGATISFHVVAEWEPALGYQWLKDGSVLPGETKPFLLLPNVSAEDNGRYAAVVSNRAGSVTSEPALLHVRTPPEPFLRILAGPPSAILSIHTTLGQRFVLESTDSLNPAEWRVISSAAGDGTVQTFQDSRPASARRFYRVRIE